MSDALQAYTGVEVDVVANAIALAIVETRKFGASEHKVAMGHIIANSNKESLASNLERIGNVSAVRQELEKAGIIAGSVSALAQAVKAELATMENDAKIAAEKK